MIPDSWQREALDRHMCPKEKYIEDKVELKSYIKDRGFPLSDIKSILESFKTQGFVKVW